MVGEASIIQPRLRSERKERRCLHLLKRERLRAPFAQIPTESIMTARQDSNAVSSRSTLYRRCCGDWTFAMGYKAWASVEAFKSDHRYAHSIIKVLTQKNAFLVTQNTV